MRSEFNLLGEVQGVVNINAEIPDGAFDLGVTEQELNGTQVDRQPARGGDRGRRAGGGTGEQLRRDISRTRR
jgi:hypothetical protein